MADKYWRGLDPDGGLDKSEIQEPDDPTPAPPERCMDASGEAFHDWWEEHSPTDHSHHVVRGTRDSIAALKALLKRPAPPAAALAAREQGREKMEIYARVLAGERDVARAAAQKAGERVAFLEEARTATEIHARQNDDDNAEAFHLLQEQGQAANDRAEAAEAKLRAAQEELAAIYQNWHDEEARCAQQRGRAEQAESALAITLDREGMLKSVHGALVDAGFRMGDIGSCEAALVRRLTQQRDAARAALHPAGEPGGKHAE